MEHSVSKLNLWSLFIFCVCGMQKHTACHASCLVVCQCSLQVCACGSLSVYTSRDTSTIYIIFIY